MGQRRTFLSMSNERKLKRVIKDYDRDLELHFSDKDGYYYISRPFIRFDEREASEVLSQDSETSVFGDALKKQQLIVCYPISVSMMEHWEAVRRNVMKHFKENDLRGLAASSKERVRVLETNMDNERAAASEAKTFKDKQEVRAYAREYFRSKLLPHVYFGGVQRFEG